MWIVIGIGALIVWVFRFTLPESPRYLATHGRGKEALDVLERLGIRAGRRSRSRPIAASDTKSDPFAVVFRMFPTRVIAGMICFTAFFGVAIGLGAWLPNIMNEKGFTITKSLQYTFGDELRGAVRQHVHDVRARQMRPQDHVGLRVHRRRHHGDRVRQCRRADSQLMVAGFIMIFFVQVAGNSMQIFASEVFPTNARASGFGWAAGVGRLATAFIMPSILWIQQTYGLTTVFVCLAILLLIAAVSVTQLGPEAKQKGLDEIAPPTGDWLRLTMPSGSLGRRGVRVAVGELVALLLSGRQADLEHAGVPALYQRHLSAAGDRSKCRGQDGLLPVPDLDRDRR